MPEDRGAGQGLEGMTRQWGVRLRSHVLNWHDRPMMQRLQDIGAVITQFGLPHL